MNLTKFQEQIREFDKFDKNQGDLMNLTKFQEQIREFNYSHNINKICIHISQHFFFFKLCTNFYILHDL